MKAIGIYGEYVVSEDFESKKFFVKIKEPDGTETSIPVRKVKRYLQLRHATGVIVLFSIYLHQGIVRYKDSRIPRKSFVTSAECAAEVSRMLGLTADNATALLGLYPAAAAAAAAAAA